MGNLGTEVTTTKNGALIGVLFGLVSAKFSGGMTLRRFGNTPKNLPWESGTSAFSKTPPRGQNAGNKTQENNIILAYQHFIQNADV